MQTKRTIGRWQKRIIEHKLPKMLEKKKKKKKSFSEGVADKAVKFKKYFATFQFELFTEGKNRFGT